MAHNIAVIGGKDAMAYFGETPWHRLGVRLENVSSIDAALSAASLDWTVSLHETYLKDGREIPRRRAVLRDTDGAILGNVSTDYRVIQNRAIEAIFQPAIDEFGLTVESAGALGQGETVWMLFRLPVLLTPVAGDDVRGYGLYVADHAGKRCAQLRPTGIRVVCQNTLNLAVGDFGTKGRVFSIDHAGDVKTAIENARKVTADMIAAMEQTGDTFKAMANRRMTAAEVITYIESVFPAADDGKVTDALAERRATVSDLIWTGVGAKLAMADTNGDPNTWATYNAVTEYFDHMRVTAAKSTVSADRSALFGAGADIKLLAFQKARELVAA